MRSNPTPAAPGAYRGGCATRRIWELLGNADATGSLCMERMLSPPFGLLGGAAGSTASVTLRTPDGTVSYPAGKGAFQVPAGSVIDMVTPGSGGYGDPAGRDPAALREDLIDGYVTAEGCAPRLRRRRSEGAHGRLGHLPIDWIPIERVL